jgi:hypothetical protein
LRFAYDGNAREINASRKRLISTTMAEISRPPFRNFPGPSEFKSVALQPEWKRLGSLGSDACTVGRKTDSRGRGSP